MKFVVNHAEVTRLCNDLDVSVPLIVIKPAEKKNLHGHYLRAARTVTVFVGCELHLSTPLRLLVSDLNRTLLHEIRHHWQYETWEISDLKDNGGYWTTRKEVDARQFEDEAVRKYHTIKPVTTGNTTRSRFSRISRSKP